MVLNSSKISFYTLAFCSCFLIGCVTTKKKDDVKKSKKFYHNFTSYYNGIFNAKELIAESTLNLQAQHFDNYNEILSVYDYVNLDNPKTEAPNLDKAIEKVSTVATIHEIGDWVDDCYMLLGKSQFLKQDFESAQETFLFFEEEFDPKNPYSSSYKRNKSAKRKTSKKDKVKAKKAKDKERKDKAKDRKKAQKAKSKAREKEIKARKKARKKGQRLPSKPKTTEKETSTTKTQESPSKMDETKDPLKNEDKNKPLGHDPVYYQGLYWLARTYIEREQYSFADYYIRRIESDAPVNDKARELLPTAKAHLLLKKQEYTEALAALDNAIEKDGNRTNKARYAFIKGQIYNETGSSQLAMQAFKRVKKYKPTFEMEMRSDINIIKLSDGGTKGGDKTIKKLENMLKETKYQEYSGAIYFAMGETKMNNGDIKGALADFKKSSNGNSSQALEAYYKLAYLMYDQEYYIDAKLYFDSTLTVMQKKDKRYNDVKKLSQGLTDIARNLKSLNLQDSLLALSNLSDAELRDFAISKLEDDNYEAPKANKNIDDNRGSNNRRYGMGKSTFFAYNPLTIRRGMDKFKSKWGNRELEDNWRRSNRANASSIEVELSSTEYEEEEEFSEEAIQAVLKGIPTTKVQSDYVHIQKQEALMNLGVLYREKLNKIEKSASTLETLVNNYPNYKQKAKAIFYLYLDYVDLNKNSQANEMKALLLQDYPDSEFTQLANDPNYAQSLIDEEQKLENYYDQTYQMFESGSYSEVIARVDNKDEVAQGDKSFDGKFALLRAMSIGNVEGQDAYVVELEKLTKKFKNSAESTRAKEILRFLKGDEEAFSSVIYEEASEKFSDDFENLHYALVVLYDVGKKMEDVKISISNFNKKYHKLENLRMSPTLLNAENKTHILLLRKFKTKEKAIAYYESVLKARSEYISDEEVNYEIYVATQFNYREVIKQKSITAYRVFFEKNYLNN